MEKDGFTPITAIFYAVFHPTEGTKVLNQVPEGCIGQSSGEGGSLFNMDTIKNYIIPKPQLCNKLISIKIGGFKVLGYPVNIENEQYARNAFTFNFCFVFPYDGDVGPYEPAVSRMGKMFQALEEQSYILSRLDKLGSFFKDRSIRLEAMISNGLFTPGFKRTRKMSLSSIESLIQQIYQDLNNYSECCIPLDSANSVDIKLFPIMPPPTNVEAYDVPLLTVKLDLLIDTNWDPTMLRILPFINGINSIAKISDLADVNYILTKQCIQHLMHYKCILITDIFQFSNIYAPTDLIGNFLKLNGMAEDCQAYVTCAENGSLNDAPLNEEMESNPNSFRNSASPSANSLSFQKMQKKKLETIRVPSKTTLFHLYRSLDQGQTLKEWYTQHGKYLNNIDLRRFINFGVVRGIIYRVNSYPILSEIVKSIENDSHSDVEELYSYLREKQRMRSANRRMGPLHPLLMHSLGNSSSVNPHAESERRVNFNNQVREIRYDSQEVGASDGEYDSSSSEEQRSCEALETSLTSVEQIDSNDSEDHRELYFKLVKLLKGFQHYDSICTELQKLQNEVNAMISELGHFDVINN